MRTSSGMSHGGSLGSFFPPQRFRLATQYLRCPGCHPAPILSPSPYRLPSGCADSAVATEAFSCGNAGWGANPFDPRKGRGRVIQIGNIQPIRRESSLRPNFLRWSKWTNWAKPTAYLKFVKIFLRRWIVKLLTGVGLYMYCINIFGGGSMAGLRLNIFLNASTTASPDTFFDGLSVANLCFHIDNDKHVFIMCTTIFWHICKIRLVHWLVQQLYTVTCTVL